MGQLSYLFIYFLSIYAFIYVFIHLNQCYLSIHSFIYYILASSLRRRKKSLELLENLLVKRKHKLGPGWSPKFLADDNFNIMVDQNSFLKRPTIMF